MSLSWLQLLPVPACCAVTASEGIAMGPTARHTEQNVDRPIIDVHGSWRLYDESRWVPPQP